MTLHVVTKVLTLAAKGQKSLVTMLKMALFALKCIDMVVNDQDNAGADPGFDQGGGPRL